MSLDQCHSTIGEKPAQTPRSITHEQVGVTGAKYWRSLEDLADEPDFREFLDREFTNDPSRLFESSRRNFLKVMGASVALAGAATLPGCRRPDHKIYSYSKNTPEDQVPGKATYFATSMPLPGGGCEGLIVSTIDGRPIKIEGNPLHPNNQGKSSAWANASILGLYDPDRLKDPVYTPEGTTPRSWDDVSAWCSAHFAKLASAGGAGLAFLVDKKRSPTRDALKAKILAKYPKAQWFAYDPIQNESALAGSAIAFGKPMREVLDFSKADVVVSLDRDFLGNEPGSLRNARTWASTRRVLHAKDPMSRLYVVEPRFTITGSKADHRLNIRAGAIPAFALALAKKLLSMADTKPALAAADLRAVMDAVQAPSDASIDASVTKMVDAIAKDLWFDVAGNPRSGRTLLVAGPSQPAPVHALVHALNAVLGNVGASVSYLPMGAEEASSSLETITRLSEALGSGAIDTLVTIGCNPVYDAPGGLSFAQKFSTCKHRLTLSVDHNETAAASTWQLPGAHYLESWGDVESHEGTLSPIQPMIAPLYAGKSELDLLAFIAGDATWNGYEAMRSAWRDAFAASSDKATPFETRWKRSLFNGIAMGMAQTPKEAKASLAAVAKAVAGLGASTSGGGADSFEVVIDVGAVGDGRFNNIAWLQELPDPITKIVWDNAALISAATAKKFGLEQDDEVIEKRGARMINLRVAGQTLRVPAWVTPGVADNTVVLSVGYGRSVVGRVGAGTGFNAYAITGGASRAFASGATIERVSEGERSYQIVTTQNHGSMVGRAIVREVDLPAWNRFGDDPFAGESPEERKKALTDSYGQTRDLNFAERLGELSHTPANVNIYENPQRGLKEPPTAGRSVVAPLDSTGKLPDFASRPQWGMSIDLTTCTGCAACTIACQAENNIPVVGKIEVNKHREMHWIRVDRYFSGLDSGGVDDQAAYGSGVMHQPVACVHCENAPCETVCPVNATVHGPEGMNYMAYNRCIGTRYCANNCPYKVRRFNFFDYATKKFKGDFIGKETLGEVGIEGPANVNLIPPRLRERVDEISKLGNNPNVTVRSRGVMEKCSYCVQRVNEARVEIKLKNLDSIPDGFFQTACQQSCPTDAIVFGDILDTQTQYPQPGGATRQGARVNQMRDNQRSYLLLGYLNTRPRTTHMISVRNPNPELVSAARKEKWEHPFHHGSDHGDHGNHGGHGSHEGAAPAKTQPAKDQKHGMLPASPIGYDPERAFEDRGYRMSLGVLGAHA